MELANAGDLKSFARNNPKSPILIDLLKQVLSGLQFLHEKGIVHRDLKPQNILLVKTNTTLTAKISDFGISRNIEANTNSASMTIGTIEYMAPEQFNPSKYGIKGRISTNIDLWSFGIMLYELVAAAPPFGQRSGNTTAEQIMNSILLAELPKEIESVDEPFRSIIRKCLIPDASLRVQTADEVLSLFDGSSKTNTLGKLSNANKELAFDSGEMSAHVSNIDSSSDSEDYSTQIFEKVDESTQVFTFSPTFRGKDDNEDNANTIVSSLPSSPVQIEAEPIRSDFEPQEADVQPEFDVISKNDASEQIQIAPAPVQSKNHAKGNNHPVQKTKSKFPLKIGLSILVVIASVTAISFYLFQNSSKKFYEKVDSLLNEKKFSEALLLVQDKSVQSDERTDLKDTSYLSKIHLAKGDTVAALPFIKNEVAGGNLNNAYFIGELYYAGKFVEQDYLIAKLFFEKLPLDDRAITMLGNLYFMGLGVEQDYPKAVEYYQKAATKGNSVAMYSLGLAYKNGAGIEQNVQQANMWFQKVLEKNDNMSAMDAARTELQSAAP